MRRILKLSLYILIILTTVVLTSTVVLGYDYTDFGRSSSSGDAQEQVNDISSSIANIVKNVGYVLALVVMSILTIQYMTATPAKKAALIDRSWMLAVGVVLLFAIPTLMDYVADFGAKSTEGMQSAFGEKETGGSHTIKAFKDGSGIETGFDELTKKKWGSTKSGTNDQDDDYNNTNPGENDISTPPNPPDPGEQQNEEPITNSDGYREPSSSDPTQLRAEKGDRIYFGINTNLKPGSGDWNDNSFYYDLKEGEKIKVTGGMNGINQYTLYNEMETEGADLGDMVGGKANCFSCERIQWYVITGP